MAVTTIKTKPKGRPRKKTAKKSTSAKVLKGTPVAKIFEAVDKAAKKGLDLTYLSK